MPYRRLTALPLMLVLAVLVTTAGCVTVHPTQPPEPGWQVPGATRTAAREQPEVRAWPLGPLPSPASPASPSAPPAPSSPAAPAAEAARPPAAGPSAPGHRRGGSGQSGNRAPRGAKAAQPAAPERRKRPPAKPGPRSAPQRSYDMAQLCAAARGTVSPSIVALCG
ncbi:hypothetical protein [Streptomyces sp. NPDC051183]|uniref:hypothetical protein n=1 Tax=Streptomyces sp. NPDC051183 TaxID=3155165 RepID=UPI003443B4A0